MEEGKEYRHPIKDMVTTAISSLKSNGLRIYTSKMGNKRNTRYIHVYELPDGLYEIHVKQIVSNESPINITSDYRILDRQEKPAKEKIFLGESFKIYNVILKVKAFEGVQPKNLFKFN